jgi:nucleotide sugar dehydrogenase
MSSSTILHAKPEEIDNPEKRGKYTVSIIGCSPASIHQSCLFADAGYKVTFVDVDQTIVNLLARGKASFLSRETEVKLKNHVKTGRLNAITDIKTAVSQSDVIAMTTPVKVDEKKKPDYTPIERMSKLVGASLRRGTLVIVMNVVGIGFVENTIKEILEDASGFKVSADFGLAYSPMSDSLERVVAATDKTSLNAASSVLETISGKNVRKANSIKAAELALLSEVVQRDVNVAFANELALLCEKACIDYLEVKKLTETDTSGLINSLSFSCGSMQEEPCILLEDAENLNAKLRMVSSAREVNEEMAKHAVNLAKDALRNCGKTLRRARVSILGISQTPNTKSAPKKMVKELIRLLEGKGAKVSLCDLHYSDNDVAEILRHFKRSLPETIEGSDCIIIMTAHDQFKRLDLRKVKAMMKTPAAIVDLEAILEPDKVEKEGFIYRGLGRGVWTK